jgi:hypothetical protein
MTKKPGGARHGSRSEVSWEGGKGRQPYANQGETEAPPPNDTNESFEAGDRGELSGNNLEQLRDVKKKA